MNKGKLIYYVTFPLLVAVLCAFSYYLGWTRGKQQGVVESAPELVKKSSEPHPPVGELTFFKTLRSTEPTPVAKIVTPKPKPAEKSIKDPDEVEKELARKGEIAVQVSAFRDIGKAHELVDELKNKGYPAFTGSEKNPDGGWFRVYVGPYQTKEEASSASSELENKGYQKGFVTNVPKS